MHFGSSILCLLFGCNALGEPPRVGRLVGTLTTLADLLILGAALRYPHLGAGALSVACQPADPAPTAMFLVLLHGLDTAQREGGEIAWSRANPRGLLVIDHTRINTEQPQAALLYQSIHKGCRPAPHDSLINKT